MSVVSRLDTKQYTLVASTTAGRPKSGRLLSNRAATNRPVLLECFDPPHFDEQDPPVLDSRAGKACTSRLSRTQTSSLSPSIVTDCRGHDLHDLVKDCSIALDNYRMPGYSSCQVQPPNRAAINRLVLGVACVQNETQGNCEQVAACTLFVCFAVDSTTRSLWRILKKGSVCCRP